MRSLRSWCTPTVGNAFIRSVYNLRSSIFGAAQMIYGTDKSVPYEPGYKERKYEQRPRRRHNHQLHEKDIQFLSIKITKH